MAKAVSLSDVQKWVDENKTRTWYHNNGKDISNFGKSTLQIKYMDIVLDTRDMKVFSISVRGFGREINVNHGEEFKGTILELLLEKLRAEKDGKESTVQ